MRLKFIFAFLLISVMHPAWAAQAFRFGPEFAFFNPQTGDRTGTNLLIQRFRTHLIANQPRGIKFKEKFYIDKDVDYDSVANGDYAGMAVSPSEANSLSTGRFISPEKWWFEWGLDDGVVEIKAKPMTVAQFRQFQNNMQDAIFASAANEGLFPPLYLGGGHINIGLAEFESHPRLLRNFIVDLYNHNELFLGIFNYDTHNAAPLDLLSPRSRKRVANVIHKFDNGGFKYKDGLYDFLEHLQLAQDAEGDAFLHEWNKNEPDGEDSNRVTYFAVNFSHVEKGKPWSRLEIRAVRAQWSMDMWVRQIDLFDKRLAYLAKLEELLPLEPRVEVKRFEIGFGENHLINPPVDPQAALQSFYTYVTESGAQWSDHRDYMWPEWMWPTRQTVSELAQFESSAWFREHASERRRCAAALTKR